MKLNEGPLCGASAAGPCWTAVSPWSMITSASVLKDDERLALLKLAIFIFVIRFEMKRHGLSLGSASDRCRDASNILALPEA